jgi:hypothetical protein
VERAPVVGRRDGHRGDALRGAGAEDPQGNFTAVCDEKLVHFEHDAEA